MIYSSHCWVVILYLFSSFIFLFFYSGIGNELEALEGGSQNVSIPFYVIIN